MLPIGLIGSMLPMELEEGFYADPPKNKLGLTKHSSAGDTDQLCAMFVECHNRFIAP
jgi:hypothetical protein